jgi:hypothetical protein
VYSTFAWMCLEGYPSLGRSLCLWLWHGGRLVCRIERGVERRAWVVRLCILRIVLYSVHLEQFCKDKGSSDHQTKFRWSVMKRLSSTYCRPDVKQVPVNRGCM